MAVLEWVDPLMSCGYWIPELVAAAGCECVLAGKGEHTGYIALQELLTAQPVRSSSRRAALTSSAAPLSCSRQVRKVDGRW